MYEYLYSLIHMCKLFIAATAPILMLFGSVVEASPYRALASWYGPGFYGNLTANGEIYTGQQFTAAHKTLPFGTRVRVTNPSTGQSITVRINDRGPFIGNREYDLSSAAASAVGLKGAGVRYLQFEII